MQVVQFLVILYTFIVFYSSSKQMNLLVKLPYDNLAPAYHPSPTWRMEHGRGQGLRKHAGRSNVRPTLR